MVFCGLLGLDCDLHVLKMMGFILKMMGCCARDKGFCTANDGICTENAENAGFCQVAEKVKQLRVHHKAAASE